MVFKFSLALILTVILMLVYNAIKPFSERTGYNNFVPLPEIFPGLSRMDKSNCDTLTRCDLSSSCKKCGIDYTCTPIGPDENVVFKGSKVPPGRWCLPEGKREVSCGAHTGRAIWTENNGWECVCLYPDLFGGKDCNKQLACRISDWDTVDQSKNVLKHVTTGRIWDPNSPDFVPDGSTPYDSDEHDNPLYKCSCDNTQTKLMVNLPGDPYRCHKEPCSESHEIPMWDPVTNKCDCTAKGKTNNEYAYSNVTKKCVRTFQCAWNDETQQCMCPDGQVSQLCNSHSMKRDTTTAPDCPLVPGGSFCNNPCEGYCLNGGIPSLTGRTCKCICPKRTNIEFQGARCENPCMKDGVSEPKIRCCSGHSYKTTTGDNYYNLTYRTCGSRSSCFISSALVTMANGEHKQVKDVRDGDVLMSAITKTGTKVLFVDKVFLETRKLISLSETVEPFVTEDHCFYVDGERKSYNPVLSKATKHWEQINFLNSRDVMKIASSNVIVEHSAPFYTMVYDIVTEDHTLIVNGISFYDDMPELEKHPFVSVLIASLVRDYYDKSSLDGSIVAASKLFDEHALDTMMQIIFSDALLNDLFEENMKWFLETAAKDTELLHLCSALWKTKFQEVYSMAKSISLP